MVLKVVSQKRCQIAGEQDHPARRIDVFCEPGKAGRIQRVFERVQIFEIALDGIGDIGRTAVAHGLAALHGVGRSGKGYRQVVQVFLELAEIGKSEEAYDANNSGWGGIEAFSHVAQAEENESARLFANGYEDL